MNASACLSDEILQALLLGKLPDVDVLACEFHLTTCDYCGARCRSIQVADPLLEVLPSLKNVAWSAADEREAQALAARFSDRSQLLARTAAREAPMVTEHAALNSPQRRELSTPDAPTHSSLAATDPTTITGSAGSGGLSNNSHRTLMLPPVEGATLGAYRIDKKLGEGGMGTVWKAFHTRLKKTVAVKVLSTRVLRDAALVARFEREMEAVGKIDHPGIVRAMDAGEINGTHYLVMEYVEGTDIGQLVKAKGARTVRDSCEMIRQAAVGLAYAHKNGLVHRDIKPSNLFLTKNGKVKVLDLGLARLQGEGVANGLTHTGQILGTPDYMAPEQWENTHTVGAASDLYALGCTLFFLLTGRAPFTDERHSTLPKKMLGHCEHAPPSLSAARAALMSKTRKSPSGNAVDGPAHDIPPELEAIYEKLLAKKPVDRFSNAEQLVTSLSEIIKARAPASTAPSPPTTIASGASSVPPAQGSRKWQTAIGGVAAALLLGVIVITIKNKDGSVTKLGVDNSATVSGSRDGTLPPSPPPQVKGQISPGEETPQEAVVPFTPQQAKGHQDAWAKFTGQPVDLRNDLGMRFRLIPPGQSTTRLGMHGGGETAPFRYHLTQPYYLGTTEVTVGQFQRFLDETGHKPTGTEPGGQTVQLTADGIGSEFGNHFWDKLPHKVRDEDPAMLVSHVDAWAFCDWLSKKEGAVYRLPTECEWFFAAAAGGDKHYGYVQNVEEHRTYEWDRNSVTFPLSESNSPLHAVATGRPNPFGLYDMLGNVHELMRDRLPNDLSLFSHVNPTGQVGPFISFCGGSWRWDAATWPHFEAGARGWEDIPTTQGWHHIGFRILKELQGATPLPKPL